MPDKSALDLATFLDASPSPFHAVSEIARRLDAAGFTELNEADAWAVKAGGKHYVIRQGSSILAFIAGSEPAAEAGFRVVGAHTDSPCLKVKPNFSVYKNNYMQIGVEVYGGVILATWLDRDLAIAGRVTIRKGKGLEHVLVRADETVLRIPNLAIHLNRKVNEEGLKPNPQTQLVPVFALSDKDDSKDRIAAALWSKLLPKKAEVVDFDLSLYDTQKAALAGANSEFILSARLDNLASCHAGLTALLAGVKKDAAHTRVLVCFDHEEVGSTSAQGAAGPFLRQTFERLAGEEPQAMQRAMARSFCVSADMAHAVHPNYSDMHEPDHMPRLGHGPVIKRNNNQRYATSGDSGAQFLRWCEDAGVKPQRFVTRNDLACGSTIGPITAAELGMSTVDVGNPMLSMHSIREMAATADVSAMIAVLTRCFK